MPEYRSPHVYLGRGIAFSIRGKRRNNLINGGIGQVCQQLLRDLPQLFIALFVKIAFAKVQAGRCQGMNTLGVD